MPIPTSPYIQVLATWPLVADERFDPTQPSPWRENDIAVPTSPDPLQPTLSILFSRGVGDAVHSSDGALSNYLFLTSLSDPHAANITRFEHVLYNPTRNLLTCRPATPLQPGARYQATLRGLLPDSAGRLLGASYSWEFDIDPGTYQGLPLPVPVSPADQSVIVQVPLTFAWGIPKTYDDIPDGHRIVFQTTVYTDRERQRPIWTGRIPSS